MLFFKRKQKADELLPPPPPDMEVELEQELQAKPKFFDETIEPEITREFPEENEFTDLIDGLEGKVPAKPSIRKEKLLGKRPSKKIKPQLKEMNRLKKRVENLAISKKQKKIPIKAKSKEKVGKMLKTLGDEKEGMHENVLQDEEFDTALPEVDFDLSNFESGLSRDFGTQMEKPKEVSEAEEEIKGAIEKIKSKEKQTEIEDKAIRMPEIPKPISAGSASYIQVKIDEARKFLMRLDLEGAREI